MYDHIFFIVLKTNCYEYIMVVIHKNTQKFRRSHDVSKVQTRRIAHTYAGKQKLHLVSRGARTRNGKRYRTRGDRSSLRLGYESSFRSRRNYGNTSARRMPFLPSRRDRQGHCRHNPRGQTRMLPRHRNRARKRRARCLSFAPPRSARLPARISLNPHRG